MVNKNRSNYTEHRKKLITSNEFYSNDIHNVSTQRLLNYSCNSMTVAIVFTEADVRLVIDQTDCTRDQAIDALKKKAGDLVNAIMVVIII
jgi:hypothetical protein